MKTQTIIGAALFISSAILFVGGMLNESITAVAFAATGILGASAMDSMTIIGYVMSCICLLAAVLSTVRGNKNCNKQ